MVKITATTSIKAPPDAERIAARLLGHVANDPNGQWLVLIGDGEGSSDPEDVWRFLREMWPDVEGDATTTPAPKVTQRRAR
jgi:hypothetical protein